MRSKPHKLEHIAIRLAVNENEVWPDMTVPVVVPVSAKCVIPEAVGQKQIGRKQLQGGEEEIIQIPAEAALIFALEISLKLEWFAQSSAIRPTINASTT